MILSMKARKSRAKIQFLEVPFSTQKWSVGRGMEIEVRGRGCYDKKALISTG